MKIAIIGTGGVGGYYGGLLAHQGEEVTFLARGAHLDAIRRHGLQIKSIHGDFTIAPARVTDQLAQIGPVDLVLLCVKTYDSEPLAQEIAPLLGSGTRVLSLQNGVDAAERIGRFVGMEHMLAGATWIVVCAEAPGVIRQVSEFRRVVLGELDGSLTPRLQAVYAALQKTGITVEMTEDIAKVLWTKFIFISAASSLGSLTRLALGEYRAVPETRSLLVQLMREVEAVARAQGVALEPDVVEKALDFIDHAAPTIKTSMQNDVAAGRRTEIEAMIGVIGRKAALPACPRRRRIWCMRPCCRSS
jgi:2-dehydropantoate 2-reductase